MVFGGLLWILISFIPLQTSPEFVVREIRACCHHHISLNCVDQHSKIAIIQARYIAEDDQDSTHTAAVIDSNIPSYSQHSDHEHHPFISSRDSVSLWDLDIKFAHHFMKDNLKPPLHVNALPEWHPDHSSHFETRRRFMYPKVTLPPKFPIGENFSSEKVIEMPVYEMSFLDKETIWSQPLFPVVQTDSFQTRSLYVHGSSGGLSDDMCLSYQTLMRDSRPSSSALPLPEKFTEKESSKLKWQFKDIRPYFNRRCSGKSNCDVYLLRNKERDQDLTQFCELMPRGRIMVKYLCYNTSSGEAHSNCNVDVTPASEGFLMNPGYPDLYPGDQPCQWRLHVPQQKILLLFFDISLRGQDSSKCRDELVVTDEHKSKLLSTCGDQMSTIAVLSETHQLNVTLNPQSRLAFPKRGFLAYYRVIGCANPPRPLKAYRVLRNSTHAFFTCDVGHIFPDTLSRERWLYCSPLDHKWLGSFPYCHDIRSFLERNSSIDELLRNNPSVWPVRHKTMVNDVFIEYVAPIMVIIAIFALHGLVLYLIWRQRSRLEEIENETNQEMEQICAAESPEVSIFSFPDSIGEVLWDHDELDHEETDQDRTLTTITVLTETETPTSSATRKVVDCIHYHEQRNGMGNFRFFQNGTTGQNSSDQIANPRPNIGYANGNLLPVTFKGYFRTTAV